MQEAGNSSAYGSVGAAGTVHLHALVWHLKLTLTCFKDEHVGGSPENILRAETPFILVAVHHRSTMNL